MRSRLLTPPIPSSTKQLRVPLAASRCNAIATSRPHCSSAHRRPQSTLAHVDDKATADVIRRLRRAEDSRDASPKGSLDRFNAQGEIDALRRDLERMVRPDGPV